MLFCCYLINISKMNTSSDNEQESQEVLLTSNNTNNNWNNYYVNILQFIGRGFKIILKILIIELNVESGGNQGYLKGANSQSKYQWGSAEYLINYQVEQISPYTIQCIERIINYPNNLWGEFWKLTIYLDIE